MIDILFQFANEIVLVSINGKEVLFGTTTFGAKMADISGLKLDYNGTIREFPDLKDDLEWREKAIERFKKHIKSLKSEEKISEYIISELQSKGYTPKQYQKRGFRPKKL